jgi:hypothetical protein
MGGLEQNVETIFSMQGKGQTIVDFVVATYHTKYPTPK